MPQFNTQTNNHQAQILRITNTDKITSNITNLPSFTKKINTSAKGKNLKSTPIKLSNINYKQAISEIKFNKQLYNAQTKKHENTGEQQIAKIEDLNLDQIYDVLNQADSIPLNDVQKLILVNKLTTFNKEFYDVMYLIEKLHFKLEKNFIIALKNIIIYLHKTLNTNDGYYNYDKVNSICKNMPKLGIKDQNSKLELAQLITEKFPIFSIKYTNELGITSKKALDRIQNLRINKNNLEEVIYNLHNCISRYSRKKEGEKSLTKILELLKHASSLDQLVIAKKMIKNQPSSLILCIDYLNLDTKIKADLIRVIANNDNTKQKGDYHHIAHGKSINPQLLLSLYEYVFADKYKLNLNFEKLDKKVNIKEMCLITTFITDNKELFKNNELLNKYEKLLDRLSDKQKLELVDAIMNSSQESALAEVIKHFKFDEKTRMQVLDKIIDKHLNSDKYVYLEGVMYDLENFEISDAEQRMKYYMHLSSESVDNYFHSNFGIEEFIKPLKDIIKNSNDINQGYAIEQFCINLLKTFIDREKIALTKDTKLLEEFTKFIAKNKNIIQPLYQSINDLMGALFLRRSLSNDLINILQSSKKSNELLELLPKSNNESNNKNKLVNRQRLTIMELYSILPNFNKIPDIKIKRLHDFLLAGTIYKSAPEHLNILLELMHALALLKLPKDLPKDTKQNLLKLCLPNNTIKNNKEYNKELCLNLSKVQLILSYVEQNKWDEDEIDKNKQAIEDNLYKLTSTSELQKLYIKCVCNTLPNINQEQLTSIINNSTEYDKNLQLFNYVVSSQKRLEKNISEKDMFNQLMKSFIEINILGDSSKSDASYYKIKYNPKNSELVEHLEKNYPQVLKEWQKEIIIKDGDISFISTDNWKYLLKMTQGRCLDIRFSSSNNIASPSILFSPQYRLNGIFDNKTGELMAFHRDSLVLNKKREPVIYQGNYELNTKATEEQKKKLLYINTDLAQKIQSTIVISGPRERNKQKPEVAGLKEYDSELISPPNKLAPFDYDDSSPKIYKTDKEYIFPAKSTHILWQPPKKDNK